VHSPGIDPYGHRPRGGGTSEWKQGATTTKTEPSGGEAGVEGWGCPASALGSDPAGELGWGRIVSEPRTAADTADAGGGGSPDSCERTRLTPGPAPNVTQIGFLPYLVSVPSPTQSRCVPSS
jgi:hypothetical protein